MNAKQYINTVKDLRAKMREVQADNNLSPQGKQRDITKLAGEIEALAMRAQGDLESEYKAARQSFQRAEQAVNRAQEKAASSWDYSRLNYAQEAVRSDIRAARDLGELEQAFSSAGGDAYKIRAWSDVGVGLLQGRLEHEPALGAFMAKLKQAGQKATTTPEIERATQAGQEVARTVLELRQDTIALANELQDTGHTMPAMKAERLAAGIQVTQSFNGQGWDYSIDLAKEAPSAEGAGTSQAATVA